MKKRLPVIIGILCICVFSFFYAHIKKGHPIYDNDVDTATYQAMGILGNDGLIQQSFICQENHLDGFYLKTDAYGDCQNVVLTITVKDAENGTVLSQNDISVDGIKNRKLNYFEIDSINGYDGKMMELSIEQNSPVEGSGVGLYIQPSESGNASLNGESAGGVLVMKHVSERFDMETFLVTAFFCSFVWAFLWFLYRLFR